MSFPPGTEMFQFPGFASPKPILFSLVIPLPFNTGPDYSGPVLNGEGGLSHSEIAGSKLAHSSPTLIAACHVLHRLYMPRHSPDALTSRLRVHTTNDSAGDSTEISLYRCGDLTQPDNHFVYDHHPILGASLRKRTKPNHVATASIKKPIHNVKEACISRPYHRTYPANRYSSSLEMSAAAPRYIATQSGWWSLSGSNR